MPKYIELEKALQRFEEIKKTSTLLKESFYLDGVMAILETIPAADVAPIVHAKWIDLYMTETDSCGEVIREEKDIYFMCSNCECIYSKRHSCQGKFCARCGAKIDLEG